MNNNKKQRLNYTQLNRKKLSQGCWILTSQQTFKIKKIENKYESVDCIAQNEDSSMIVQGCDRKVIVIKLISFKFLVEFNGHKGKVNSVVINRDSTLIFSGSDDGNVRIWDLATRKCIRFLKDNDQRNSSVISISLNIESTILVSAQNNNLIKKWDLTTFKNNLNLKGHQGPVLSVAINRESSLIVSGGSYSSTKLWDVETGELIRDLIGNQGDVLSVAFNKESSFIVSGCNDRTIRVQQVDTGDCVKVIRINFLLNSLLLSQDSLQIVAGCQRTVGIWNVESGDFVGFLKGSLFVAMSRDSSMLVTKGYYNSILIYNMNYHDNLNLK